MGINSESDVAADLTASGGLPLDFEPDEADEIAEELRAAAARARKVQRPR